MIPPYVAGVYGSVQKFWDDRHLSNASFAFIYPFFSAEEMNRLEAAFLNLLHFEVVVKPTTYAEYYFRLQAIKDVRADRWLITEVSRLRVCM